MIATNQELKTPADKKYGYRFGCDGVVPLVVAMSKLGDVCRATIYRRVEEGVLRKGNDKGRAVICKRSLDNYLNSIES